MGIHLFQNPKTAMGFAGAVIAGAFFTSIGFQGLPSSEERAEGNTPSTEQRPIEAPTRTARAAPQRASTSPEWSDDGLADDWHTSALAPANKDAEQDLASENLSESAVFGEYSSSPMRKVRTPRSIRAASSSGPIIKSGAAPGAPELEPPTGP